MRLRQAATMRPSPQAKAAVPAMRAVAAALGGRLAGPPTRPDDATATRLAKAFANHADWGELPAAVWRDGCWLLWGGPVPLGGHQPFLDAYLMWLRIDGRRPAWVRAIHAYLADYRPDRPGLKTYAAVLAATPERAGVDWARRQRQLRLFDPVDGPVRAARALLVARQPVEAALGQFGLDGPLRDSGFSAAAFIAAVKLIAGEEAPVYAKLFERIQGWGLRQGKLIWPATGLPLMEGVVGAWSERVPPPELRQVLTDLLAGSVGDPRRDPKRFASVMEGTRRVFGQWLMLRAIERYLPLVEALGFENDWTFRRSFWLGFLEAGGILDAELLEPAVGGKAGFGRFEAGGGAQVVLLMRLPGLTIADWSHNGRCYWWRDGNPAAPKLHRSGHDKTSLSQGAEGGGITHARADSGVWQRRVSEAIRQAGGPDLGPRHYMPQGWSL